MKKGIEPSNLFGESSLIYSKEEAGKILRDNSYYIFVAAFMALTLFVIAKIPKMKLDMLGNILLILSIYYFIIGVTIRVLKSRVASVLALISFGYAAISNILTNGFSIWFIFSLIFLAASYRCVRASFFYHKKYNQEDGEE